MNKPSAIFLQQRVLIIILFPYENQCQVKHLGTYSLYAYSLYAYSLEIT
jgi:hypothetical protein